MKRLPLLLIVICLLMTMSGCGGSQSTPPPNPVTPVSISVSPATSTVNAGLTVQMNVTVQNTTNTAVTWQVNGVAGGDATNGTIGSDGVYHSPGTVPNPASVTITAVSVADPTKSASANVSIIAPVSVTLAPAPASIAAGGTFTFGATVHNHSNQAVTWKVNGSPATGVITPDGVYTAPKTVPAGQTIFVIATSQIDPSKSATATVPIVFSGATFSGQHVVVLFGSDMTGNFWLYGQFTSDDSGHVVSGKATFRKEGNTRSLDDNVALNGTYTLNEQGRGLLSLTTTPPTINNSPTVEFGLVVLSDKQARLTTRDPNFNGQGDVFSQDSSALSTAASAGTWVFRWGAGLGRFDLDAAGNITGVVEDSYTTPSTGTTYTGSYSVGADGRGLLTISSDPLNAGPLRVYVVDSDQFYVLSKDLNFNGAGFATRQKNAPFSTASLKGSFAFSLSGRLPSRQQTSVGLITADGAGGFTGQIDNAYSMPSAVDPVQTFAGTYQIDASGRVVLTPSEGPTIYAEMFSSDHLGMLATATGFTGSGQAWLQQGAPFTTASLKGSYSLTSTSASNSFLAIFDSDGAGSMTGIADILQSTGVLTDQIGSAVYTVESNGRGTLTTSMGPSNATYVFYMVSPTSLRMAGPTFDVPVMGSATMRY